MTPFTHSVGKSDDTLCLGASQVMFSTDDEQIKVVASLKGNFRIGENTVFRGKNGVFSFYIMFMFLAYHSNSIS